MFKVQLLNMRKSTLYTGDGDSGTTSLVGGHRVPKSHQRLEAFGTIDELNAFIGLLITETEDTYVRELMKLVQHTLFSVGSYLAADPLHTPLKPESRIMPSTMQQLEQGIDRIDGQLPEIKGFVLPGGCRSAALAHVCRTVCRRAERQICRLKEDVLMDESVVVFINRLSDLLFVIARYECFLKSIDEIIWDNTCK